MSHGPQHQIEHAEHAAHASHDSFDRQVTISIAIVAAVLAAVTMLGHRAHNETLQLQGQAIQERSDASNHHIEASDQWNFYQAQNIRSHQYKQLLGLLEVIVTKDGEDTVNKQKQLREQWKKQVDKYEENLQKIMTDAKGEKASAKKHEEASDKKLAESHAVHERSMRFDVGELFLQLGVVLCSLAILTKQRGFWYTGLLCSLAGLAVALTGVFNLFMDAGGHH